ncbi:hypothetical protein LEMLEM_LOCUS7568 [Lemmus lemmus]
MERFLRLTREELGISPPSSLHTYSTYRGQERASDRLELVFQMVVTSLRLFYEDSPLDDPGQTLPSTVLPLPDKVIITSFGD